MFPRPGNLARVSPKVHVLLSIIASLGLSKSEFSKGMISVLCQNGCRGDHVTHRDCADVRQLSRDL